MDEIFAEGPVSDAEKKALADIKAVQEQTLPLIDQVIELKRAGNNFAATDVLNDGQAGVRRVAPGDQRPDRPRGVDEPGRHGIGPRDRRPVRALHVDPRPGRRADRVRGRLADDAQHHPTPGQGREGARRGGRGRPDPAHRDPGERRGQRHGPVDEHRPRVDEWRDGRDRLQRRAARHGERARRAGVGRHRDGRRGVLRAGRARRGRRRRGVAQRADGLRRLGGDGRVDPRDRRLGQRRREGGRAGGRRSWRPRTSRSRSWVPRARRSATWSR